MKYLNRKPFYLVILLVVSVCFSCKNESVQSYIVASQEKEGFVNVDIPASIIKINKNILNQDDREAYESIRKINIVGLPYKNSDKQTYESEKTKIKGILKKSSYKKLVGFKNEGVSISVYYLGESDAVKEIIALGYGEEFGVGLARVLGENMNPSKIVSMIKNADLDEDQSSFHQLKKMFSKH